MAVVLQPLEAASITSAVRTLFDNLGLDLGLGLGLGLGIGIALGVALGIAIDNGKK